jgi:dipeptidyl aminopeptidase/acylaminoacyl peptidase
MGLWRVPLDGGEATPLVVGVGAAPGRPSFSADGRRLIVAAGQTTSNLARVRFDAAAGRVVGAVEALTRGANHYGMVDVSPDGAWLVCTPGHGGEQEDLYILRSDGSGLRRLTDDAARDRLPRFSADGKRVVFYSNRGGAYASWSIGVDGSGLVQLAGGEGQQLLYSVPSPVDGRVAVWVLGGTSFIFDAAAPARQEDLPAYPEAGVVFVPGRWSADGARLLGSLQRDGDEPAGAASYDPAARRFTPLFAGPGLPLPLADPRRLLVWRAADLDLLDLAAGARTRLLSIAPDEVDDGDWNAALSRDEGWLYFARESADGDVWLVTLD